MGAAHELVVIDVAPVNGNLVAYEERLEKALNEAGKPVNNIPFRTFWSRKTPPQGCFAVGDGVMYVQEEPGLGPPRKDEINLTRAENGSLSYPVGLRHPEGGIGMAVLILPPGEAADFIPPPNEAKVLDKNNRLAAYWIEEKGLGHYQILLQWKLRPPNGTLQQEAARLNPQLRHRLQTRALAAPPATTFTVDSHSVEALKRNRDKPLIDHKVEREWVRADKIALITAAIAIVALVPASLAVPGVKEWLTDLVSRPVPIWSDMQDAYVGGDIVLKWKFDGPTKNIFEIAHARDERFAVDPKSFVTEAYWSSEGGLYTQRVEDVRNQARYFRVRAVDPLQHDHALSGWSEPGLVSQYDNSYRRIASTHRVIIGVSNIDNHNDLFKWTNGDRDGVDIQLMKSITSGLSPLVEGAAELPATFRPLPWPAILSAPARGQADMVVAAISKRADREQEYGLSFSEPYFCTTQALIYRAGEAVQSLAVEKLIAGKRVGFEKPSTSERLVVALSRDITISGGAPPDLHAEERPAAIVDDVRSYKIDIGVTDLPFAVESILNAHTKGDSALDYRPIDASELPSSVPDASRFDEYAVALRRGDRLLPLINQSLTTLKDSGALTRLIRATIRDYEQFRHFPEGALATPILHPQPWTCKD